MRLHVMVVFMFAYIFFSGQLISNENTKSPQWQSAAVTTYVTKLNLPDPSSPVSSCKSTPAPSDDEATADDLIKKAVVAKLSLSDIENCATPTIPSPNSIDQRPLSLPGSRNSLTDIEDLGRDYIHFPYKTAFGRRDSSVLEHGYGTPEKPKSPKGKHSGREGSAQDHGYGTPEKPKSPKGKRFGRVEGSPTDHGYSTPPDPNKPKTPEKK